MAIIKYSAIVEGVTGKLSGSTFSHNRNSHILRTSANGSSKIKPRTKANQLKFSAINNSWRKLTTAQRNGWKNLSKIIDLFTENKDGTRKTAFQVYQSVNYYRLIANQGISKTAPGNLSKPLIRFIRITINSATISMVINIATLKVIGASDIWLYATKPHHPHTGQGNDNYKFIRQIGFSNSFNNNIAANYLAVYGRFPAAGEVVKFRAVATLRMNYIPTYKIKLGVTAT